METWVELFNRRFRNNVSVGSRRRTNSAAAAAAAAVRGLYSKLG